MEKQMMEALDRVWTGWTKQAAELHTFRADHENRMKEGKGFFKLNNDSIAAVCEDLAAHYQALADRHFEEVLQILEEYGATDLEIACQLQQYEVDGQATRRQIVETVELPDNPLEEAASKLQGEPGSLLLKNAYFTHRVRFRITTRILNVFYILEMSFFYKPKFVNK